MEGLPKRKPLAVTEAEAFDRRWRSRSLKSQGKGASEISRLLGIGQASVYRATRMG
jgi:hypothetical protein